MKTPRVNDVQIENHGSTFLFCLRTKEAHNWVKDNVDADSWQWLGKNNLAVDPHYAGELAQGMQEAGLDVS